MLVTPFSISTNRKIILNGGSIRELAGEIKFYGSDTVLFTGGKSLEKKGKLGQIEKMFSENDIKYCIYRVDSEPSPELVDKITAELRGRKPSCLTAVGGGSVIDTAKAVSAMLCEKTGVCDFLEGVGDKTPSGKKVPFIAVPTTAGTGSEATYNAVLSRVGENGFKKSLRHKNYTPDVVIIDPDLYAGAPAPVAASSGLDALSQLVEAYVSTKASFFTDILVSGAIEGMFEALPVVTAEDEDEYCDTECSDAWLKMAYGSYISGLALANSGLAVIHGMAGTIGGFFNAPHGAVCGTLLAAGMKATIEKLEKSNPESPALLKLAKLGYIAARSDDLLPKEARSRFIQRIEAMTENMGIKRLSAYGIHEEDLEKIADASSNKNNPVALDKSEMIEILKTRL